MKTCICLCLSLFLMSGTGETLTHDIVIGLSGLTFLVLAAYYSSKEFPELE